MNPFPQAMAPRALRHFLSDFVVKRFRSSIAFLLGLCFASATSGADSVQPYQPGQVPQTAVELWADVDFEKDPLETEVVKQWREDGVICRYVIFTVGTFKGKAARCAAFYSFPEDAKKAPAFVWAHGGGQRAERTRGLYFAKQGYATLDLNWGGREISPGITANTDWGAVDPSQGPRFYPGALRPRGKLDLAPDEHTIDSVTSPRNGNWYLLAYAGRRAITFLQRQDEVDPDRIGFTGYSMGGNITSMAAIDGRLKAVIPMVGGSGFIMDDFPGLPDSGRSRGFKNVRLYNQTIDARSYWPQVKCPVLFLSASDDFHGIFDHVYKSVDLLPHNQWRVSQLIHQNHSLGPQQWILVNRWFDHFLKGTPLKIAQTARTELVLNGASARYFVTPDRPGEVSDVDVYYSHDPNARSRFWIHANAQRQGDRWTATLPVREKLPLYAFANLTYPLEQSKEAFQGLAHHYTITSDASIRLPEAVDIDQLNAEARADSVFEDFPTHGLRDWAASSRGGISTYKFRDPRHTTPDKNRSLQITVNVPRERLSYRFRIEKRKYLSNVKGPQQTFSASRTLPVGPKQKITLHPGDFLDREQTPMKDWDQISTFRIDVYDGAQKVNLSFANGANSELLSRLEWVRE